MAKPGSRHVAAVVLLACCSMSCAGGSPAANEPVAVLTASASTVYIGDTVLLDASSSHDPNGKMTGFKWDFDGDDIYGEPGAEKAADASAQAGWLAEQEGEFLVGVQCEASTSIDYRCNMYITVIGLRP